MKEVKFRAWDKIDKRMIVHEQDFIPLKVTNIGVFRLDPSIKENRWELINDDRFEIMQYTGLKDKNGKEIYEGDIVKENNSIGKVIYNDCEFRIIWIVNKDFYNDVIPRHNNYCEVIGDIYENPELLER